MTYIKIEYNLLSSTLIHLMNVDYFEGKRSLLPLAEKKVGLCFLDWIAVQVLELAKMVCNLVAVEYVHYCLVVLSDNKDQLIQKVYY